MTAKIDDVLTRVIPERRATKTTIQEQMIADTFGEVIDLHTLIRKLPSELRAALAPSVSELTQSVGIARASIDTTSSEARAAFMRDVQELIAAQNAAVRAALREAILAAVKMLREEMATVIEAEKKQAALALSRREPTARMPGAVAALFAIVVTLLLVGAGGIAVGFWTGFLAFAR